MSGIRIKVVGKGKGHHRTGHDCPEGDTGTLSLTSALDVGGQSVIHPGRFTPRKDPIPSVIKEVDKSELNYV